MKKIITIIIAFILSVIAFADGMVVSRYADRVQETHQIAIIKLQKGRADVSMYIGISNIPEGKTITYILPFWYKPDNFILQEEKSVEKIQNITKPLNEKIYRLNLAALFNYGEPLNDAWTVPIFISLLSKINNGDYYSYSKSAGESVSLNAYQISTTTHAKAMLYKIGIDGDDLQQLIHQSGLPDKLIKPLQKYKTPYFAVMKLTGLKKDDEAFGRGIMYSFSHQLKENKYTYPLGTGAGWAKPIPLTEIIFVGPEKMKLSVTAPQYGNIIDNKKTMEKLSDYDDFLYIPDDYSFKKATGFKLDKSIRDVSELWQIGYFNANPDQDITATFSEYEFKDNFKFLFLNHTTPYLLMIFCLVISWYLAFLIVVKPYSKKNHDYKPFIVIKDIFIILGFELILFNLLLLSLRHIKLILWHYEYISDLFISLLTFVLFLLGIIVYLWAKKKINQKNKSFFMFQPDYDHKRLYYFWCSFLIYFILTQSLYILYPNNSVLISEDVNFFSRLINHMGETLSNHSLPIYYPIYY